MSIRFLKVKVKSLTAEARIIRREEERSRGELRDALRQHRREDVRREQRATQVAYGYLRGITYSRIEPNPLTEPDWKRVESMVNKYGGTPMLTGLESWRKARTEEKAAA